jgi:hypothetical protein
MPLPSPQQAIASDIPSRGQRLKLALRAMVVALLHDLGRSVIAHHHSPGWCRLVIEHHYSAEWQPTSSSSDPTARVGRSAPSNSSAVPELMIATKRTPACPQALTTAGPWVLFTTTRPTGPSTLPASE